MATLGRGTRWLFIAPILVGVGCEDSHERIQLSDYYYCQSVQVEVAPARIRSCTDSLKDEKLSSDQTALALSKRGEAYLTIKSFDSAIVDLSDSIRVDKRNRYSFLYRAQAYEAQNKIDLAKADYQMVISLAPDTAEATVSRERLRKIEAREGGTATAGTGALNPATTNVGGAQPVALVQHGRKPENINAAAASTPPQPQEQEPRTKVESPVPAVMPTPKLAPIAATKDLSEPKVAVVLPVVVAPARPGTALESLTRTQGERREALVVGNSAYQFGPLANPANDARGMAEALRGLGFEVDLEFDLDRDGMLRATIDFSRKLADGGVGLFYYAGHALQAGGRNYLVPVGARIESEDLVPIETVELDQVLFRMGAAPSRLNIVILDACRDNPFARSFRGLSRGLAATPAPAGVFIAYATAPGGVANDGDARHSPYTAALIEALDVPGLRLEDVFKHVLSDVRAATRGKQTPWTSASITGDFFFRLPEPAAAPPVASADYGGQDMAAWGLIKGSTDRVDFESYLEAFPESPLAPLARSRLRSLAPERTN